MRPALTPSEPVTGRRAPRAGRLARRRSARRRRITRGAVIGAAALVAVYLVIPHIAGLERTWQRIHNGSPAWFALAVLFEFVSFAGYVWLLRRIAGLSSWSVAWRLTLAGVAATRVVTVAGAGGIAVTIQGLRNEGLSAREAVDRQAVDLVVLYGVFFGLMLLDGVLLLAVGQGPALSLAPALIAGVIIAAALGMARVPASFERVLQHRFGRPGHWLAALPASVAAGVRGAIGLLRRRDPALTGALVWWLFDVAAMWACIRAFGGTVSPPEVLMAYLAGHAFNVLPVPGGVGPVEGGLIAALVAFGEPAGLALVGVLSYQLVSVWLPAVPGAIALTRLRHRSASSRSETR